MPATTPPIVPTTRPQPRVSRSPRLLVPANTTKAAITAQYQRCGAIDSLTTIASVAATPTCTAWRVVTAIPPAGRGGSSSGRTSSSAGRRSGTSTVLPGSGRWASASGTACPRPRRPAPRRATGRRAGRGGSRRRPGGWRRRCAACAPRLRGCRRPARPPRRGRPRPPRGSWRGRCRPPARCAGARRRCAAPRRPPGRGARAVRPGREGEAPHDHREALEGELRVGDPQRERVVVETRPDPPGGGLLQGVLDEQGHLLQPRAGPPHALEVALVRALPRELRQHVVDRADQRVGARPEGRHHPPQRPGRALGEHDPAQQQRRRDAHDDRDQQPRHLGGRDLEELGEEEGHERGHAEREAAGPVAADPDRDHHDRDERDRGRDRVGREEGPGHGARRRGQDQQRGGRPPARQGRLVDGEVRDIARTPVKSRTVTGSDGSSSARRAATTATARIIDATAMRRGAGGSGRGRHRRAGSGGRTIAPLVARRLPPLLRPGRSRESRTGDAPEADLDRVTPG